MSIMDTTIVNVAIPSLGHDFGVTPTAVDVVVISYLVSLAVFIPASGWIGDRFGGKRALLTAILVFTMPPSALCGLAGNLTPARPLPGPAGRRRRLAHPDRHGHALPNFPSCRADPPGRRVDDTDRVCPGGWPRSRWSARDRPVGWRWVFYMNLPIGLAACVFGLLFVQEQREARPGRFDVVGFVLAGIGLGSLMYGVSEGPLHGWTSTRAVVTLVLGVGLLVVMVMVELRIPKPLIDLHLLRDRSVSGFQPTHRGVHGGFLRSHLYLVPLYYQDGRGLSALASGLGTFPEAVGVLIGAQVVSRKLYPTIGPRRLVAGGMIGAGISTALMSLCGSHTSLWWMRLLMFTAGYSIAHVFVSLQAAAFATMSPASTGRRRRRCTTPTTGWAGLSAWRC